MIRSLYEGWWTAHFNVYWKILFGFTYFGLWLGPAYPQMLLRKLRQLRGSITTVGPDLRRTSFALHIPVPFVNLVLPQSNFGSKGYDFFFAPVSIFGKLLDQNLILVLILTQTFLHLAFMAIWVWMFSILFWPSRCWRLIAIVIWVTEY